MERIGKRGTVCNQEVTVEGTWVHSAGWKGREDFSGAGACCCVGDGEDLQPVGWKIINEYKMPKGLTIKL